MSNHRSDKLDLTPLPPVYVLATHLSINEQQEVEDVLARQGAPLTYDIKEANLVLGNIVKARRAKLELLWKGVRVKDIANPSPGLMSDHFIPEITEPSLKRRKFDDGSNHDWLKAGVSVTQEASMASERTDGADVASKPLSQLSLSRASTPSNIDSPGTIDGKDASPKPSFPKSFAGRVKIVKLDWLNDSIGASRLLSLKTYIVYEGHLLPNVASPQKSLPKAQGVHTIPNAVTKIDVYDREELAQSIVERAKGDLKTPVNKYKKYDRIRDAANKDSVGKSFSSSTQPASQRSSSLRITRPTQLLHQTTSENDETAVSTLPPMPDWVRENKIYACERSTPLKSPNQDFICQLKKIKLARLLTLDEIGVRAYSTSIASLAAYPYPLQSAREILALPGCDQKIAHLFQEWKTNDGHIRAVEDAETDPALKVLREFYEIWGVGAKTAREFYYDKGWQDLDDIVEYGWKSLSRVQQIGLKYYDEFLLKIPRVEVEAITAKITDHAKLVTDENIQTVIVGGYRRGKSESGDVDVILSHRDEAMTYNLVDRIVRSLEKEGSITHTLTLNLTNTKRNQETLPINAASLGGHGFDTLDKALVVWQDPNWPTKAADLAADPKAKNPNPHRRVDIIISPWRTVGCAVAGWTSGTTFQRDLRRYAKYVKGWKFDSSGVRQRGTGGWVDLEGWTDPKTRCRHWKEAEMRVFEGLGLTYREPWERNTG